MMTRAEPSTIRCALTVVSLLGFWTTPIRATEFVYDQISASVPGLSISASITIDGDFADLPTLDQSSQPIDFGNLLALDLLAPNGVTYTLSDFVATFSPPFLPGFPQWMINPSGIRFIDCTDSSDFIINFAAGTIRFETDRPSDPPDCHRTGACVTTGRWDVVPEPPSVALLLVGLIGLGIVYRHAPAVRVWSDR